MNQTNLWQTKQQSPDYAELCNALYERELSLLSQMPKLSVTSLQGRLKSLAYYVQRTADAMIQVQSPLDLDVQNATWSCKQASKMPLADQQPEQVWQWFEKLNFNVGLVVPVALADHIVLDSIDKIDLEQQRFRGNRYGWFDQRRVSQQLSTDVQLLKPGKRSLMAACAGHCWQPQGRAQPVLPSLRELLLSCAINWQNFRKPLTPN